MKRWAIGFVAFLLTLGIGTGVAAFFVLGPESEPVMEPLVETVQVMTTASVPNDDFVPEFRDLPDLGDEWEVPTHASITIFNDGNYRKSEVVAKNGESWLILTKEKNSFSLRKSAATVRVLKTVSWPGDEPDAKLSFKLPGKPIFALRQFGGIKQGKVHTALFADDESGEGYEEISDRYRRQLQIGDRKYLLRASRGVTRDGTRVAVLVIESGGTTQVIKQVHHSEYDDRDILGHIIWAGDLNRDGGLDIYFDEFNEKGYTSHELFLSLPFGSDRLMELAASFAAAGC